MTTKDGLLELINRAVKDGWTHSVESAGKRRSGRTRPGDVWLADALTEAAWAVARTCDTYLAARFRRIAGRKADDKRKKRPQSRWRTKS